MNIITASEKHIPIIQKIARSTWYATYSEILSEEQSEYMLDMMYSTDSLKDQIEHKKHVFLLGEENEEYLGYISYESNYEKQDKIKIHKIYVLPTLHKKGVGRKLIETVIAKARSYKHISVLLDMNKHNPAIGFYKSIGFEIVDSKCTNIGHDYVMDDYILELYL